MDHLTKSIPTVCLFICLLCSCSTDKKVSSASNELAVEEWDAFLYRKMDNQLGEGAFWNYQTNEFWHVDIIGKTLYTFNPANKDSAAYDMEQMIGTVVPTDKGNAVVALEDGVYIYDMDSTKKTQISSLQDTVVERFNDGKCDPSGRLWVGTIGKEYSASLYRIVGNGDTEAMVDSVTISNGIVWSGDKKTMYYIDTPTKKVKAYDYDDSTGNISNERVIIEVGDLGGPDGMAIDAEGMLWVAIWGGDMVGRWDSSTGELIGKIKVPARNVTSCAFGGTNLDTLFITTAQIGMKEEIRDQYPDAGSVFAVVPGVKGVKSNFFKE